MKNVKLGFMALAALVGITSAFTNRYFNIHAGITGTTTDGSGNRLYQITTFDELNKKCALSVGKTCSFTYTGTGALPSTILTTSSLISNLQTGKIYTNK
ncbi:MAG: hypothetical protein BGO55_23570 [Sphingobacteriales bacterium 50-39]|nr:hypothetical protein [Sphingobacteriales bacterium]OJW58281.1 MAG: hypothetical protein BGO55_23570 [Sphingobacteriales bacterium 50-39]